MYRNSALLGTILLLSFFVILSRANERIAVVIKLKGEVRVTSANSFKTTEVKKGYILQDGDKLETGPLSYCAIKFLDDKSLLRIKEKSTCTIEGKRKANRIEKNIFAEVGAFFMSLFKQEESFKVTTPTSVASVKGTNFWVLQSSQSGESKYVCTEGAIEVKTNAGKVLVKKGQTAIVASRSRMPEVRLTRAGDIPADEIGGPSIRNLDFEFIDDSGQTKVLRIIIKNQE